jgi:hypothetical protein
MQSSMSESLSPELRLWLQSVSIGSVIVDIVHRMNTLSHNVSRPLLRALCVTLVVTLCDHRTMKEIKDENSRFQEQMEVQR